MTHIAEMWKTKRLAIPNWNYMTTLEWDCSAIFAIPIFGITHNIFLSVGLSNVLLTILFLYSVYFVCLRKRPEYFLLASNILLIPYSLGMLDYYNMMFFGVAQYIVKVTVPILLVGILHFSEMISSDATRIEKRLALISIIIYFLYLLCTSMSSGIYVGLTGFVPVIIGYVIKCSLRKAKSSNHSLLIILGSIITVIIGIKVNKNILGGTRADSMTLASVWDIKDNVGSNFFGIFELTGALSRENGTEVLSIPGVAILSKLFLTLILIVCALIMLSKLFKNELPFEQSILTVVFFFNLFIMLFSVTTAGSSTTEYRYHLMGIVPLMIASSGFILDRVYENTKDKLNSFEIYIIAIVAMVAALAYYGVFNWEKTTEFESLSDVLKQTDCDCVYVFSAPPNAEMLNALDVSKPYVCLMDTGETYAYDFYGEYSLGQVETENTIMITDSSEQLGDEFTLKDLQFTKYDSVDGWGLYYIE